jgi:glycine cleavage system H lipoate-binding protein
LGGRFGLDFSRRNQWNRDWVKKRKNPDSRTGSLFEEGKPIILKHTRRQESLARVLREITKREQNMHCPFLNEAEVKFCKASSYKKMILNNSALVDQEKCSSPRYRDCPSAQSRYQEMPQQSQCPHLDESLVQYCSAASVTKYIPYSESLLSRCGTDAHELCEVYMSIANPELHSGSADGPESKTGRREDFPDQWVEGIRIPGRLAYTTNHLWLERNNEGHCRIGVDAFFAHVVGRVEKVDFVTTKGIHRPTAVFTVRGVEMPMTFPSLIEISDVNTHLRKMPDRLTADPFAAGWLFEGKGMNPATEGLGEAPLGLMSSRTMVNWMDKDVQRMTSFVHHQLYDSQPLGEKVMADGGLFTGELIRHLSRDEILNLYNGFFSPYASWRRFW